MDPVYRRRSPPFVSTVSLTLAGPIRTRRHMRPRTDPRKNLLSGRHDNRAACVHLCRLHVVSIDEPSVLHFVSSLTYFEQGRSAGESLSRS
jgi:hypothetical protein